MIFYQNWTGYLKSNPDDMFEAKVPGNIQSDYGKAHNYGDVNYGMNFEKYKWLEDEAWVYETRLVFDKQEDERVYFVTKGIDYEYDVVLNEKVILSHEGMFSPVEKDITDYLSNDNNLKIIIKPIPKYAGATEEDRVQAVDSCKPAVGYGWDWHPRFVCSGIWCDTYIETRNKYYIKKCEVFYTLTDNYEQANVTFDAECEEEIVFKMFSPDGKLVYEGKYNNFIIKNPLLWWCNGQGNPDLYTYEVTSKEHRVTGKVGFRSVELVMNDGAWNLPYKFPKTRSVVPITVKLNGRNIFAKGSNWVNPEMFNGEIDENRYCELLQFAKDANMNILRIWGGSVVNKDEFFDICDELGIMVWQEFPLSCNNYIATPHYLKILKQEAEAIIKRIRRHPCHVLWCGGNELFNSWSKMTDQSLALRLLNKLCYEFDMNKPFIATSPLYGMSHGAYLFYSGDEGEEVFELIQSSKSTAYTEFGLSSVCDYEYLKTFIPQEDIDNWENSEVIRAHHGINAWRATSWICKDVLERYFGKVKDLKMASLLSSWLQCEGYKSVFEEARRQKPYCSMAINWCFCEPWKTVANNSLISYPSELKPSYYAVKKSLQGTVLSARIPKFMWYYGEMLKAELWLLNDSTKVVSDTVKAYIEIDGKSYFAMEWNTGNVKENTNKQGNILQFVLPECNAESFVLKLVSLNGYDNEYKLRLTKKPDRKKNKLN